MRVLCSKRLGVVLHSFYRNVVTKRKLSKKAKLSIYWSVSVPTLTYGHEEWVMTKRARLQVQVAEMCFFRRVAGVFLRNRVRSSVIRKGLQSRAATPLCGKESVEVVWASGKDASWLPP